jgi:hypothetical protein
MTNQYIVFLWDGYNEPELLFQYSFKRPADNKTLKDQIRMKLYKVYCRPE